MKSTRACNPLASKCCAAGSKTKNADAIAAFEIKPGAFLCVGARSLGMNQGVCSTYKTHTINNNATTQPPPKTASDAVACMTKPNVPSWRKILWTLNGKKVAARYVKKTGLIRVRRRWQGNATLCVEIPGARRAFMQLTAHVVLCAQPTAPALTPHPMPRLKRTRARTHKTTHSQQPVPVAGENLRRRQLRNERDDGPLRAAAGQPVDRTTARDRRSTLATPPLAAATLCVPSTRALKTASRARACPALPAKRAPAAQVRLS
jgi:hypothetical protein